jgi:hypothetical protein
MCAARFEAGVDIVSDGEASKISYSTLCEGSLPRFFR